MSPATLDELQAYARTLAGPGHDEYSAQALSRAFAEYALRPRPTLARYRLRADGRDFASTYAALADPTTAFETAEILLVDPPREPGAWEWLRPFDRVRFLEDGAAEVDVPERPGSPERAIARLLLREHYVPRSREEVAGVPADSEARGASMQLQTLRHSVAFARSRGVVVLSVALLLYFGRERVRYELDLVGDTVIRDARARRWPLSRRVHRTSRISHAVDRFLARGDLPVASARALEALAETHGVTPLELAPVLGGVREYGASALQGLAARNLATYDRRTGVYRPRFDAFLGTSGADDEAPAPLPNPQLRTSVMELLAAADSRATCPLCGDALPPGPKRLLCAKCEAEVGEHTA